MNDDLVPLTTVSTTPATGAIPAPAPAPTSPPPARRPRRWLRRLAIVGVLLVGLLIALPSIVGALGLTDRIVAKALADFPGQVRLGKVQLAWWKPVELSDVEVRDADGRMLAKVPNISTSKTLFGFVADRQNLGTITVREPQLYLIFENDTTNLEKLLQPYLKSSGSSGGNSPTLTLELQDGQVQLEEPARKWTGTLSAVAGTVTLGEIAPNAVEFRVRASAAEGTLEAKGTAAATIITKLSAKQFPLEYAAAGLRRFDPQLELAGRWTSELQLASETANDRTKLELQGTTTFTNLVLKSPSLGPDTI
ncbi:MAG: hypothetical protein ACRCZF_26055, partial [Gemmataceae bacterium]